jgi:hypothetical protein
VVAAWPRRVSRLPDQIADLAAVGDQYEGPWVLWNPVRTVLSSAALAGLVGGLTRTRRTERVGSWGQ